MNNTPASGGSGDLSLPGQASTPGGTPTPEDMPNSQELEPHVIYLNDPVQPRCATWRLSQGHEALALFTSSEAASAYQTAHLNGNWQVFRPGRTALLSLLRASEAQGVLYAVLDPAGETARRIFDVPLVLQNASEE